MSNKIKMTIEFNATDEYLKSDDYKEILSDIENGNLEDDFTTEGISNVKVGIKEN